MSKLFYKHFGDAVPREIEREYNKMLRREHYLAERDAKFMTHSVSFDDVQEIIADTASLPINEIEIENTTRHNARLDYLPIAMEMLRCDFPEGYQLICDYYYSEKKITLMFLAAKYGLTLNMVFYRMQIARDKLKNYIIMHESSN